MTNVNFRYFSAKPPGTTGGPIFGTFTSNNKVEGEAAAMEEAKEFLKAGKEYVEELKTYEEWVPSVMQADKPVILDCYAE